MAKLRLGYLLMSTALTVVLSTATTVRAAPDGRDVIAAAIPLPETADVKPLTPADVVERRSPVVPSATAAAPSTAPATTEAAPEQKAQDIAVIPTDPVAAKIKELLSTNRFFSSKKERVAAEAFYSARTYAPLWESAGRRAIARKRRLPIWQPSIAKASTRPSMQSPISRPPPVPISSPKRTFG